MRNSDLNTWYDIKYTTPTLSVYEIECENVLCSSGSHDSFIEDDGWEELLDNE